jgi:hypothetical protein
MDLCITEKNIEMRKLEYGMVMGVKVNMQAHLQCSSQL